MLGTGDALLAVDVGGTYTKAAIVDRTGTMSEILRVGTPAACENGAPHISAIAGLARRLRDEHPDVDPVALSLALPGAVDRRSGVVRAAENLGWKDVDFRAPLTEALGLRTIVCHDVWAAGMAESRIGAAVGYPNSAVIVIGTGIAAAIFDGGRSITGRGAAGELGHVSVTSEPVPPCVCGRSGCLESIASARAITRRYELLTGEWLESSAEVIGRAAEGDDRARKVWDDALDALAVGVSTLAALLDPEIIVFSGGLAEAEALVPSVCERLGVPTSPDGWPALRTGRFVSNAGIVGAAVHARTVLAGDATNGGA